MKALRLASFILITQSLLSNVESLIASSRRSTACGFLKGKIYCFGGDVPEIGLAADTSLLVLDLTVSHTTSINSEWQIITDAERADIAAGARGTAQTAVYGEGDTMIISGGFTTSTTPIIQTIAYSASSNSWRAIDSFMDGVNGKRQIYWGTSIYVPPQQKFYFFGGLEQNPHQDWYLDTETNTNFTNIIPGPNKTSTLVGYYRMTTLDIGYSSAWSIIPSQNGFVPSLDHYLQTVIFHPDSQTLYYFGGAYNNLSKSMDSPIESHSFTEAMTFNTVTNTWGVKAFTGDIPLKRVLHTTTLLPSNQEVLLYGGASEELAPAVSDFCYVANLQTFTWKVHSNYLTLPKNVPPARAEHSAVLVDTKLFILFGYVTGQSALTSDTVLILDVSNTEKLSFVSEYAGLYGSNTSNVGAIAGGVVGGVGGLLLVAAAVFFYKRKQKAKANDSSSNSVNGNEPQEPVVDWDDIESKFIAHPVRQSTTFSPMITPNTMNTVIANDNKYYPPNEIELPREKTLVEKTRSLTMELSPAMTAASASPSANTMVPPYSPGFSRQSTVLSSPDVSHATPTTIAAGSHSPNVHSRHEDELLISQGFTNITKPDVGSS